MTPEEVQIEASMRAIHEARMAGKRLPELEHIVLTSPRYAYIYAKNVIKGRWIEAEDVIMTDAWWSYCYALFVIKDKLPEKMHNMMFLHAIKNPHDRSVKGYLHWII